MQRKLDADRLLSQMLIGLLLIGYVAIVYVAVVAIGVLPFNIPTIDFSPPWWLNLLAFMLIALTFLPVFRLVRVSVRDLIYSQHDNPFPALTQLNQHLKSTLYPHAILPTIAETIASTLKLPYIEIETRLPNESRTAAPPVTAFGRPLKGAAIEHVPLDYHGTTIGELRVSARGSGEQLSYSDKAILHELAQHVGIALYAAQLTDDLQHARERLVIAREEERRRIRNDLHDGLAPTLSSLQLQLSAVRNLMRQDPDRAEAMINDVHEDLRNATAEIRQLVYDLRPPMLDELGLIGAMQNSKFHGGEVCIEVNAPESMPKLSAAVEVAVYRIANEALHNVVKHAQATACEVRIELGDGDLTLKVTDNGKSLPDDYQAGIGLISMKERAAELGGTLLIRPNQPNGTCVIAQIPINR